MSVELISGINGSGKSYETVKNKIVPNLAKGRDIKTNIKGLDIQKINEYCMKKYNVQAHELGTITVFPDSDILKPNFFPYLTEENNQEVVNDKNSVIKAGDFIVVDEALRFWPKANKMNQEHSEFFRMHRHFVSAKTGDTCDLVVVLQSARLLHPDVKDLCVMCYHCKKLLAVGRPNSYRIIVFDGNTMLNENRIANNVHNYDPEIFPLYKSHAGSNAKENRIDERSNIFMNKKLWFVTALIVVGLIVSSLKIYAFFHPDLKKNDVSQNASNTTASTASSPQSQTTQNYSSSNITSRIVGVIDSPKKRMVLLEDEHKNIRLVSPQVCYGSGLSLTCIIDNKQLYYYSNIRQTKKLESNNENKNN